MRRGIAIAVLLVLLAPRLRGGVPRSASATPTPR